LLNKAHLTFIVEATHCSK